ncbi:Panacea domain-containing protein [Oscillatoria sp. HE19RPO]|uniref:Panacea domain-containing protein n=1 Tax=Oscillatoria sp. HE19RPO TaxID=2954806 RepID=UPI0020C27F0D|nr:type II toxin-antitoxin system antitoxin SocA domain-containing protein [Oscillatoria sp. HE19RPO]
MVSPFAVANYFIWLANETGSFLSNLKLQKLVYYAQAWHLALEESPLFEEDFEAWIHGPVLPTLYQKYESFSWKPIIENVAKPTLNPQLEKFLKEIADVYFWCDAYELELMTHQEDPWKIARGNLPLDAPSTDIIKKEWMKEYYAAHAEETEEDENFAESFSSNLTP